MLGPTIFKRLHIKTNYGVTNDLTNSKPYSFPLYIHTYPHTHPYIHVGHLTGLDYGMYTCIHIQCGTIEY